MRKVFLEDLPRIKGKGKNIGKEVIDWKNSVGRKIKFIYEDIEGEVEIIDYHTKKSNLFIKYLDKKPFKIHTEGFKKCGLGNLLNKRTKEFKLKIGDVLKDNKRDLTIIDFEYREKIKKNRLIKNEKWYKYKCNKCGYIDWKIEYSLVGQETNCACCCPFPKVAVLGINTIWDTTPWMITLVGEEIAKTYTKASDKKINPICPDCGRVKKKKMSLNTIYTYHSIGCSCGDGKSYPEKLMFNILEQLDLDFETEYIPEWIKPKKYDFYFEYNNKKYIVEMDGYFHKNDNKMNGQTKEESKEKDNYKDKKAGEHDVNVIRIECEKSELELIKDSILDSKLNSLFDLSKIDWIKAEEFALSNLCKKACEFRRNDVNLSTLDIAELMKLARITVTKYLKKGTKLGWCNYDAKEEMRKNASKNGKRNGKANGTKNGILNGKKVEIFKDGKSLGIFKSCSELSRQSEELFGIKLNQTKISAVAIGKRQQYKGFTFKYIEYTNTNETQLLHITPSLNIQS